MTLRIREYSVTDENEVVNLWVKCNLVVAWNNPRQDIERKLKVNPELFLVGTVNNKLIATVMAGYEGHRGWINYLAVDPAYQRKKYGLMMMKAAEQRLMKTGCPKICLQVRQSNTDAIEFYQSIGYQSDHVVGLGKRLVQDDEFCSYPFPEK